MGEAPVDFNSLNPLYSQISEIFLLRDDGTPSGSENNELSLMNNVHCKFEKLEMVESVFEQYPKGSITVRDLSDIVTVIQENEFNTILIKYLDNTSHYFYITSTSYLNNAASETSENYVSINFTNHLYHIAETESLVNMMNTKKPTVSLIHEFIQDASKQVDNFVQNHFYYADPIETFSDITSNFVLYKPLHSLDSRTDIPVDNFVQYFSYLSSYAINNGAIEYSGKNLPRFLFWTGWDNTINFKYFHQECDRDSKELVILNRNDFRYAVYDSDTRAIEMPSINGKKPFKKIYSFLTQPATQFMSTKSFYVRKTPIVLNPGAGGRYDQMLYQYQDEGEKYNISIVTSDGIVNDVPPGSNEISFNGHWGYYDDLTSLNKVNKPNHIGNVFGLEQKYVNSKFMGITGLFPYIDNIEMWRHQFDITPLHPNCPLFNYTRNKTNLDKIISLRYDIYKSTNGIPKQLEKIREIERQNFVAYVLCCLATPEENLQDETFFAAITGYTPEVSSYAENGVNGEPLKYLYYFIRLKPTAPVFGTIPPVASANNPFRAFETTVWDYDITSTDKSVLGDYATYAVNLNERMNAIITSDGIINGKYAPGWHALSILTNAYTNVTYRPIGHDIKDLKTSSGCPSFDCGKYHIVRMTKTPIKRLLIEAGVTDATLLSYYTDRYLYTFAAENVTDGRCPTPTP